MNAAVFDTLAFSKRLQEAGVPAVQAEAHASAQADFLTHHLFSQVTTKDGLQALRTATEADFQALRVEMKAGFAELETRLTMRMLLMAAVLATLMIVFKFIG